MTGSTLENTALRTGLGVILFITSLFYLNMLSRLGLAALLPNIENELSLAHAEAGGLYLFVSLGYSIGLFGSTFLSARICHQRMITISSLAVGGALLAFSLGESLAGLRAALTVLGIAGGLYLPSGVSTITSVVTEKDWGKALSIHQLAPNLAYVTAPLVADVIMIWFSWRHVTACYGLASLILGILFSRRRDAGNFCSVTPSKALIYQLLNDRGLWVLILFFSLALGLNQGIFLMMPLYLTAERGMAQSLANHLLGLSRIAAFGAPLVTGWISDAYGLKKTLYFVVLACSAAIFFKALAPGGWIGPALFFQAVTAVCILPLGFAALSRITTPENRNVAVALTIPLAHFIGAGIVPTAIGFAGDLGNFNWGLYLLGGLTLLGLFLLRYLKIK